ncbi:MAG: RDD family protein [Acidobacteria bacterium]|nr:RDD family protein [Acidobacteriota bacterium]
MFCPQCGTPAEGAAFCPSCGAAVTANAVAAPVNANSPAGVDATTQLVLAGWWIRVGATIIDSLILAIPSLLLTSILPRPVGSILEFAYLYLMWMRFGATLGNQVTKTKIVSTLGGAIDSRSAMIRGLVLAVPAFIQQLFQSSGTGGGLVTYGSMMTGIGTVASVFMLIDFLLPLFDKRRQSIHDKAANTLVIKL